MAPDVSHRSMLMDQAKRLKFGAIFSPSSGSAECCGGAGSIILPTSSFSAVCGTIGGYLWFLAMSWMFQHLPPLNGDQGSGRKTP